MISVTRENSEPGSSRRQPRAAPAGFAGGFAGVDMDTFFFVHAARLCTPPLAHTRWMETSILPRVAFE